MATPELLIISESVHIHALNFNDSYNVVSDGIFIVVFYLVGGGLVQLGPHATNCVLPMW